MANQNLVGFGPVPFDTGSVSVSGGTWVQVANLQLGGSRTGIILELSNTGAAALTHFKLSRAATSGGAHQDWMVDADLNTATAEVTSVVDGSAPPNVATLASGGKAQIKLDRQQGVQEIGVWAQSTGTTVDLSGTAF